MKLKALLPLALAAAASSCSSPGTEDVGSSESAVKVCGTTTIKGINVYHGDNGGAAIDWSSVKAAGIDFAFAKATESTNYTDSMFAKNWAGMKSAGVVRGAYHFFHSDVDPIAQATYFLGVVGPVSKGDLLVLDLETTNGQSEATVSSRAAAFLAKVESATGVVPLLYASPAFLTSFSAFGAYPLWVANYGVTCPDVPSPWKTYTFWQSTGSGSLPVISGALDLDSFNGTLAELQALGGGMPTSDGGTNDAATPPASDGGGVVLSDGGEDAASDGGDTSSWQSSGCGMSPRAGGSTGAALVGLVLLGLRRRRCSRA